MARVKLRPRPISNAGETRILGSPEIVQDPARKARNDLIRWCEARGLTVPPEDER